MSVSSLEIKEEKIALCTMYHASINRLKREEREINFTAWKKVSVQYVQY